MIGVRIFDGLLRFHAAPILLLALLPLAVINIGAVAGGLPSPLLNADFLLATWLTGLLGGRSLFIWLLAAATFAAATVVQLLDLAGYLFFIDITQALRFLRYFTDWPKTQTFAIAGIVLAYTVGATVWAYRHRGNRLSSWAVLAVAAAALVLDVMNGRSNFWPREVITGPNVVSSGFNRMLPALLEYRLNTPQPASFTVVSYETLRAAAPATSHSFVLSIGVESLGMPISDIGRQRLNGIVRKAFPGFTVDEYAERFEGSTLSGELRALCGLTLQQQGFEPTDRDNLDMFAKACLPKTLSDRGWRTLGAHGNTGRFYERFLVYPAIGFQQRLFAEDFADTPGSAWCSYVWKALCDRTIAKAVAAWAGEQRGAPAFAHIMTLDSHFPLAPQAVGAADVAGCNRDDQATCHYFSSVQGSLTAIAEAFNRAPRKPDVIVVWGDHAPPFLSKAARSQFSAKEVPVYVLRAGKQDLSD